MSNTVHTYKNTSFEDWKDMVLLEFTKMNRLPVQVSDIRHKHGWEAGDTPYSWADHLVRREAMQARTREMKRLNPGNYQ
jgi:hypothetical protein